MNRTEYNACMAPHMTGSKTKEERKTDMCIGAKLCSGKAETKEEAERICLLPKEPKPEKERKGRSRKIDTVTLAKCIIGQITDGDNSELDVATLANVINKCSGVKNIDHKKQFLKKCITGGTVTGDIKESNVLRKRCLKEWGELNEAG